MRLHEVPSVRWWRSRPRGAGSSSHGLAIAGSSRAPGAGPLDTHDSRPEEPGADDTVFSIDVLLIGNDCGQEQKGRG